MIEFRITYNPSEKAYLLFPEEDESNVPTKYSVYVGEDGLSELAIPPELHVFFQPTPEGVGILPIAGFCVAFYDMNKPTYLDWRFA